ncbi:carboxyltransferase domain-containing protein [uncultured Hyphomonas sp.]|uniref:5-oxoprolinase subunit B family protein n=1 Tax=uncultured Hyphomonas sp. TaxID=225298 RepID=UPI002AAB2E7F|nr:carboxyltransferase domain-containing protein [uncultured Hyphomonas sp.]
MSDYQIFLLGDDAVAVRPSDRHDRHPLARSLREAHHWIDVVPGKEIVAAQFDPAALNPQTALDLMQSWLNEFRTKAADEAPEVRLQLDITGENAPDLEELAARNDLSVSAFLEKVVRSSLVVDMLGFTPGFAYVEGLDPTLNAERLAVPRQRVAAGSVGLLSGQLGLYGLSGPGGWPLIGRLTNTLFDPNQKSPFLLTEGTRIRLELVGQ